MSQPHITKRSNYHENKSHSCGINCGCRNNDGLRASAGRRYFRYTGVDAAYVTQVQKMYANLPKTLRDQLGEFPIFVYPTMASFKARGAAQQAGLPPVATQIAANGAVAVTYKLDNSGYRTIVVFQKDMQKNTLEYQQRTIAHEAMHMLDFSKLHQQSGSDGPAFRQAMQEDMEMNKAVMKGNNRLTSFFKGYAGYYAAAPRELFAELGARIMFPPADNEDREMFVEIMFPKSAAHVRNVLLTTGIVPTTCDPDCSKRPAPGKPLPKPEYVKSGPVDPTKCNAETAMCRDQAALEARHTAATPAPKPEPTEKIAGYFPIPAKRLADEIERERKAVGAPHCQPMTFVELWAARDQYGKAVAARMSRERRYCGAEE
jgi:hypothetical protein